MCILVEGLTTHPEGIQAVFNWMIENWTELEKCYSAWLGRIVPCCISSQTDRSCVEDFFQGRSTKAFEGSLAESLDFIAVMESWVRRDRDDVRKWLEEYLKL